MADKSFCQYLRQLRLFDSSVESAIFQPLLDSYLEWMRDYQHAAPGTLDIRAHSLPNSSTLSSIVSRHIHAAGINCHSKGAHVFRHSFATRMLQKGHSLKEIADVLGHRHLGTTFIYTKVDFNALKQVGLVWPREVT